MVDPDAGPVAQWPIAGQQLDVDIDTPGDGEGIGQRQRLAPADFRGIDAAEIDRGPIPGADRLLGATVDLDAAHLGGACAGQQPVLVTQGNPAAHQGAGDHRAADPGRELRWQVEWCS